MSLAELHKALQHKTLIYGATQTIRNLKKGTTTTVLVAANCPDKTKKTLTYYATFKKVPLIHMEQPSDEIALICKRNHPIAVLSY